MYLEHRHPENLQQKTFHSCIAENGGARNESNCVELDISDEILSGRDFALKKSHGQGMIASRVKGSHSSFN